MNDKRMTAPLMDALEQYKHKQQASMHVPGHKNGASYRQWAACTTGKAKERYDAFASFLAYDVTEVDGTDDLHQPEGAIQEAQELAAACFGAEETHFLIGGSTVGNLAAILTCCAKQNDLVIVQRNVHKSILNGLRMAGARAVFISGREDKRTGLISGPPVEVIREALERYPMAKAVIVCNPNYYGMGIDLKPVAEVVHHYGAPLIVDEAHGAHYGLHPQLPHSALQTGADLVIQSTHKMLTSMTMSAMLHVQGDRVDRQRLKKMLTMLQSSSPSYPLMASLDLTRYWIDQRGSTWLESGLYAAEQVRQAAKQSPMWGILDVSDDSEASARGTSTSGYSSGFDTLDPFKLVLWDKIGRLSGYELLDKLQSAGVVAEMADPVHVVLIMTLSDTTEEADRVIRCLKQVEQEQCLHEFTSLSSIEHTEDSCAPYRSCEDMLQSNEAVYDMKDQSVFTQLTISEPVRFTLFEEDRQVITLPVEQIEGYEAAEAVVPYPPGIPIIIQGERLTARHITLLQQLAAAGAKCQEVTDKHLRTLKVCASPHNSQGNS